MSADSDRALALTRELQVARVKARAILGDQYDRRIASCQRAIRFLMDVHSFNALESTLELMSRTNSVSTHLTLLAAYVEIKDPTPASTK